MKTIRRFSNPAEAGFARSLLESVGIQSSVAEEHAHSLNPAGIRLQVSDEDTARALDILDRREGFVPLPADFVPPQAVTEKPQKPETSTRLFSAFITGGLLALGIFLALALLVPLSGGRLQASRGGLLFLFVFGGIVGLVISGAFSKARREAQRSDMRG